MDCWHFVFFFVGDTRTFRTVIIALKTTFINGNHLRVLTAKGACSATYKHRLTYTCTRSTVKMLRSMDSVLNANLWLFKTGKATGQWVFSAENNCHDSGPMFHFSSAHSVPFKSLVSESYSVNNSL